MSGTDMLEAAQSLHAFKETFFQPGSPAALESLSRWARSAGHPMLAAEAEMAARDTDAAEAEFNRMCIGPYRLTVPPYESVWRSHGRVLNNRYSAAVEYAFSEVGLTSHGKLNEMPDFFGNELEFLSCVASMSFQYRQKGDAAAADELEAIFRRFWSQHLGHWADTFLDAVAEDTRSSVWLSELSAFGGSDGQLYLRFGGAGGTALCRLCAY